MDVIVVGSSGFGLELLQYLQDAHKSTPSVHIKGFLDDDPAKLDSIGKAMGVGIIGDTRTYAIGENDRFIISLGDPGLRRKLAERLARRGARFISIVHPTAYVAPTAWIGHGCVIGPFANVGSYAHIEDHVLLNLYSAAGHDARIGAFCVFSPYSVANGGSRLEDGIFLGTHAAIMPNVWVGAGSKVAAGAVLYRDVPRESLATGNPGRVFPFNAVDPGARVGVPDRQYSSSSPSWLVSPSRKLSCVFIGSQSLLIQCAERFRAREHTIRTIVSNDSKVQAWAEEHDITCITPGRDLAARLAPEPCDYLFSIAHLAVIRADVLGLPRRGAINFHDGLLPEYAGLNVTSWALMNKEREHGVTWHLMSQRVDEGDILKQVRFPIAADETACTLNVRCYEAAIASFEELLIGLEDGTVQPRRQNPERYRYYARAKRPAAAGSIDWSRPAADIAALLRALEFGPYSNPLMTPKVWLRGAPLVPRGIKILDSRALRPPGTVTTIRSHGITVCTGTNDVVLGSLATLLGSPLEGHDLRDAYGFDEGDSFDLLSEDRMQALSNLSASICTQEDFWLSRLTILDPIEIPFTKRRLRMAPDAHATERRFTTPAPFLARFGAAPGDVLLAAFFAYLSRIGGQADLTVPFRHPELDRITSEAQGLLSPHVPLHRSIEAGADFDAFLEGFLKELALLRKHGSYMLDVGQRYPAIGAAVRLWHDTPPAIVLERVTSLPDCPSYRSDVEWTAIIADDARTMVWRYHPYIFDSGTLARIEGQFGAFLNDLVGGGKRVKELTVLSSGETERLGEWNRTGATYERDLCVHHLFEAQAQRTPGAAALVCGDKEFNYAQLNARANQVARCLIDHGVEPGALVGLLMDRCADMIVGMMGILKAGAAYVPLDPTYPKNRLAYMVEDAQVTFTLSHGKYESFLSDVSNRIIALDRPGTLDQQPVGNPLTTMRPDDLAYVIYTSGSTGKPKGVMVEHRNVVNFFAGMDERLDHHTPGTWLAVTSISFDISVLEIFWTLARGFKVVLYDAKDKDAVGESGTSVPVSKYADAVIDFSLFYFASDEDEKGRDKYTLLLEGAKFADRNGFEAVWTPERHFHAFGGLYPNPSVASAAIAAVTEKVKIRAGSCVLPLHSPIRVAEEWALVDNLSNGRVGISFASGWQPNDFAIAPGAYEQRHKVFSRDIGTVRALWRGESRTFRGPRGEIEIKTLPRPVQPELPCWVTAAGNPETFRLAGQIGANLLTHLLGQGIEGLAEKLQIYRLGWREAGHPTRGIVTLMLHTFVAEDEAFVRAQVHGPFKAYLRSATDLLKQHASSFPAFRNTSQRGGMDELFEKLSEHDMEALLEHAFARYFETSGLFGTPNSCMAMVERLKGIGVDEIACLIDFGVPSDVVIAHLPHLDELRQRANGSFAGRETDGDQRLAGLLVRHSVTHLQCTPSMATILVKDQKARPGLHRLKKLIVGGEAFPKELATELKDLVSGLVINMYGPTETTVWSATHDVTDASGNVPLGTPIANTYIYILDENLQPVTVGVPGELVIGGDGVARGYLNRPDLTAERFIADPFKPGQRLFRTGDKARWRDDGVVEFLGRLDNQVKIRGHRVELGEIEAILASHPAVHKAVVVAREDAGSKRLVGYVVPEEGRAPTVNELRDYVGQELPEFMVPATFVTLATFPLTPNKKVDRNSLPAPDASRPTRPKVFVAPRTPNEAILAGFFQEALALERVGILDNFIELGGDSLSAVEIFMKIERTFKVRFPLVMVFQTPTVADLAQELERALGGRAASVPAPE
jgi:sugar O-acyltransferase (sialic acid O-acetyltransferase NeuD family)